MTAGGTRGRAGEGPATGRHREGERLDGWPRWRRSAVAALGATLAISMTHLPAWADQADPGGSAPGEVAAPVQEGTEPDPPPAEGTDPQEPPAEGTDPQEPPEDGTAPPGDDNGYRYGGHSLGPAPLETLPEDPAYPVPEPPAMGALPEGVDLPEEVDDAGVFQPNVICDPVAKPGVIAVANLLSQHYQRPAYSLARDCIDLRSEHYDGRAVDWTLDANDPQDRRIGDAAVTWLTANDGEVARRLGIQSIIWNRHSWHSSDSTWRAYVGQSPHTDHVHISLNWDGAFMRTSWWTGVPVTAESADRGPCAVIGGTYAALPQGARHRACSGTEFWPEQTDYATVRPGGQGEGVALLQDVLEVEPTGVLDQTTRAALLEWQDEQGIPQTGVADQLSYAAALGWELPDLPEGALAVERPDYLVTEFTPVHRSVLTEGDSGEDVAVLQRALEVEDDGIFGPKTAAALTEFAEAEPLLRDDLTETNTLVWHLLEQRAYPHLALRTVELELGDTGYPVPVVQELLEVEPDGVFGPITQEAVVEAQAAAEIQPSGVIDGATWQAIAEAAAARAEAEEAGAAEQDAAEQDTAEPEEAEPAQESPAIGTLPLDPVR